ncbi:hypothetical protein BKG82_00030 [Mycobacteroides chelonae]|uniref:Uncharacterized protein n=1 Tax=Mycobacteroides chelonae TaxID=1774 RepID=A0A1S1LVZ9_MYCCH|nr:hypothetical protein [Mycobacteroides chelonae]OHU60939.1 hypothetical protein BKG82_00030 [Mycobacteroides chelonae]
MARRIEPEAVAVEGLRDLLIEGTVAALDRIEGTSTDVYDFRPECDRLRERLADLADGNDVLFHRWGDGVTPDVDWPPGVRMCRLVGDSLVPADDEIVRTSWE